MAAEGAEQLEGRGDGAGRFCCVTCGHSGPEASSLPSLLSLSWSSLMSLALSCKEISSSLSLSSESLSSLSLPSESFLS